MYRFTAFILSLFLIVSLSSCGGAGSGSPSENPGGSASGASVSLSGDIGGEITVSTYDTMQYKAFLEDAARLFEEKYPGTKVNVETFSAMPEVKTSEQGNQKMALIQIQDDPQGRQDYIGKVSTALMGGKGADILAMDVLPVHKLADGRQLENLAAYMEADPEFNRADYRENILDAIEYKDGVWFLPVDYTFDYYAYDSTLFTEDVVSAFGTGSAFTAGELTALVQPAFDGSSKLFNTPDYTKGLGGMWGSLFEENYASFVDLENRTAHFDDGRFEALLQTVKEYGEQGYVPKGATGQTDAGAMMQRAGDAPTDRFFFKPKNIFSLVSHFMRSSGIRMNIMISGGAVGIEDDDEIAGIRAGADGSVPFTYTQAYGINSNSQNKETAWAFLKFLLGEEMQLNTNLMLTSLPLRNAAREQKAETVLSGMMKGGQAQPLNDAQREAIAGYNEAVEQLSDQINAYVFSDAIVGDMIAAEVQYFFDGSKTAAEVADMLQSKVDLYLNENG